MSRKQPTSLSDKYSDRVSNNDHVQAELEPIAPEEAVRLYLAEKETEIRDSSLTIYRSALRFFVEYCSQEDITNLNKLTGRDLHKHRIWRREDATEKTDKLNKHTEQTHQKVIRRFVAYAEQIDAVQPGLHAKVRIPQIPDGEFARSATVDPELARQVLDWLGDYEYASLEHVVWALLTDTGARIGTIRSLDVDDYCPKEDTPHIRVRHRPETGTKLKNGADGERLIALSSHVCAVIDDYLESQRTAVVDDHGREPLLATSCGRISRSTIRKYVYKWTRPCEIGEGCPHDRDPDDCEATKASAASKCPSSESPHAIRRGYITHQLTSGVDRAYVGGRCDVSDEVLDTHYDSRDQRAKMEVRSQALNHAKRDHSSYGGQ